VMAQDVVVFLALSALAKAVLIEHQGVANRAPEARDLPEKRRACVDQFRGGFEGHVVLPAG